MTRVLALCTGIGLALVSAACWSQAADGASPAQAPVSAAQVPVSAAQGAGSRAQAAGSLATPRADGPRFDVSVKDAPAQAFFQGLVDGTDTNILIRPEVSGRITLTLKQVTLQEVLESVRDLYGYDYRPTAQGFLILPATLQSRVFRLNYLDLQRYGVSKTRVSSGQITQGDNSQYGNGTAGPTQSTAAQGTDQNGKPAIDVSGTSVLTRNDSDFWTGIEADLHALIGNKPGSSVVINRQSGVIIVHAMPAELRDVSDYLQKTAETVTRQVVLEAKVVEVELNHDYQAGINWAAVLKSGSKTYTFGQAAPPNGFDVSPLVPSANPIVVGPGNPVTSFASKTLGGAFTIAADFADFNTFIELLSAQGRTKVLSSPRVSTLHNQKAIIKAGSDEFFVTSVQSNTVTGTATSTSRNVELTPFFSGVALDVTPQISDDGSVILHMHPTISEVTDQTKTLTIDGTVDTIPLALSQIRESDSIVRARSGQLIVIGGLMRQSIKKQNYKTPFLGDVPGVGRLFRSEREQSDRVELVILLRPLVVGDEEWPALAADPQHRAQELASEGKLDTPVQAQ
ncbi:MAG TPA: pilus (MSHA type) biogenesis protein MshL [Steroidobacteraceae bacterium]|nr:pilus (MSHA type) biogenesis protein MshL [Steroidobacteraceae bacterium]